jgi:hypothetical protein
MKNKTLLILASSILTIPGFAQQQPEPAAPVVADEQPADASSQQQQPPPANGGWRRVGDGAAAAPARDEFGQPRVAENVPAGPAPSQLIIPAGTWIKIRVDQPVSSDRNAVGDTFAATLAQPVVADGFVIARRGQTVEGRVSEAAKAGKAKGTSRLGVELISLALVDGRQMPLRTQLMQYSGGTSVGRDIAAAGTATGTGAAIGAVAGGGVGAAIGAAVGAAASGIGVLTTRGRATEIYPETEITFRTLEPITVNTERGSQAFAPVRQQDFEPTLQQRGRPATIVRNAPMYPYYGGGYWGNYWGPGFGYSPYWGGSSLFFYSQPRFYGGFGGGYRGGFRGRR